MPKNELFLLKKL